MRRSIRQQVRRGLIRTHSLPVLGTLYRKGCHLGAWVVGRRLARMPGVEGVFLRHSHPSSPMFVPGQSDLDLTLVFQDEAAEDPFKIRECSTEIESLSRLFFFVWPPDARYISRGELSQYVASPWPPELLYQPGGWTLLAGKEVRNGRSRFVVPDQIPWHPEFNKWWGNILQSDMFAPHNGLDTRYMRAFYRAALKSQIYLQAARGMVTERAGGYLEDGISLGQFISDPDLVAILADLKERNFWAEDANNLKSRILQAVLVTVGDFYGDWKAHPENIKETLIHPRSTEEPHRSYYEELKCRVQGQSALTSILEAAVAYPSPHWYPYEYQVDLIFRDGLSPNDFTKGVRAIRLGFGGRTFAIGAINTQVTIILNSIYRHPLYFLGLPFPFLREHIEECGAVIYGAQIKANRGTFSRADLTQWCRMYLPFHKFNFKYRPEYFSKDCNYYQLASLRLFLETGEILTDPPRIRQAYLDRFVTEDRNRRVLDYYLHRAATSASSDLYADAFTFVSDQYRRVESLLGSATQ